jgi:hypothetical protein
VIVKPPRTTNIFPVKKRRNCKQSENLNKFQSAKSYLLIEGKDEKDDPSFNPIANLVLYPNSFLLDSASEERTSKVEYEMKASNFPSSLIYIDSYPNSYLSSATHTAPVWSVRSIQRS